MCNGYNAQLLDGHSFAKADVGSQPYEDHGRFINPRSTWHFRLDISKKIYECKWCIPCNLITQIDHYQEGRLELSRGVHYADLSSRGCFSRHKLAYFTSSLRVLPVVASYGIHHHQIMHWNLNRTSTLSVLCCSGQLRD